MKSPVPSDALMTLPANYGIRSVPVATDSHRLTALVVLAACVTLCSLYLAVRGVDKPGAQAVAAPARPMPANVQAPDIQAMVDRLATRLQREPENGPGWQMLAKSYAALGRFADAAAAYRKAAALLPTDASLLADYADVLVMTQAGSFEGEPARLIRRALEINPQHPKVLALAGTEKFRRNDIDGALRCWNTALEAVPADSELAVSVRSGIAAAEGRRAASVGQQRR